MRNCMFKIAKLAAFSRKNISKNARSLDTGQNCTLWTKLDTMDKNWTLWTKIVQCGQKLDIVDKNWTQ